MVSHVNSSKSEHKNELTRNNLKKESVRLLRVVRNLNDFIPRQEDAPQRSLGLILGGVIVHAVSFDGEPAPVP